MTQAAFEQKAALVGLCLIALICLLTVLEERFGVRDNVRELVEAKRRRERKPLLDQVVSGKERWRRKIERLALWGRRAA